jgi:CheY-like chemotaxis protein
MGGKEAVQKLLELDPAVRAIVSSGYANDPIMANCTEYGFVANVHKPYQMAELAYAVEQHIAKRN